MTQEHPITPPPELGASLRNSAPHQLQDRLRPARELWLINHAYAAGADQELEASLEWLVRKGYLDARRSLPNARRPKPPSLKEQALADLDSMSIEPCLINGIDTNALVRAKYDNIRRALESLDD